ncbi:hypothetical protein BHM03_00020837 [Ensete ventricosum]|nr:hypothetical protein BHM03_00020837 [Ensete ventricosum]
MGGTSGHTADLTQVGSTPLPANARLTTGTTSMMEGYDDMVDHKSSKHFEGKRLLERHRLVNTALAEQMKQIHALSIKKALTPAQWNPSPTASQQ